MIIRVEYPQLGHFLKMPLLYHETTRQHIGKRYYYNALARGCALWYNRIVSVQFFPRQCPRAHPHSRALPVLDALEFSKADLLPS